MTISSNAGKTFRMQKSALVMVWTTILKSEKSPIYAWGAKINKKLYIKFKF